MKKNFILLLCFIIFIPIIAQESSYETVIKLQTEKEYSEWLQKMLEPLIGTTLVQVDLKLKYPNFDSKTYGIKLDNLQTLPGLPVAKSANTAEAYDASSKNNYAEIVSKSITIMVSDKVKEKKLNTVLQYVKDWMHIDEQKGDRIKILKSKSLRKIQVNNFIIYLILIFFFFIFLVNFKNSIKYLAKSLQKIRITGFDRSIHVRGSLDNMEQGRSGGLLKGNGELNLSPDKAIPIKVVKDDDDEDNYDNFHFLEKLDLAEFKKTVHSADLKDIAYVFSRLTPSYIKSYFLAYPKDMPPILKAFLEPRRLTRAKVEELRNQLYSTCADICNSGIFTFNGLNSLIDIMNSLPIKQALMILDQLKDANPKFLEFVKKKVFLPESIPNLTDSTIKIMIRSIDHNVMVNFLASVSGDIKKRFFQNMTERSHIIFKEDIQLLGELAESEKETYIETMVYQIRKILYQV